MSLNVVVGPMKSSKTSWLISKITLHVDIQKSAKCLIINSTKDDRDPKNIISCHSSSYRGISPKIAIQSVESLSESEIDYYDIIGINEAQFFDDLHDFVKLLLSKQKHIYVSGLDSDFMGESWGHISELLYLADEFHKVRTLCAKCMENNNDNCLDNVNRASFTAKLNGTNNIIEIGADIYAPMCRIHHKESLNKWKK